MSCQPKASYSRKTETTIHMPILHHPTLITQWKNIKLIQEDIHRNFSSYLSNSSQRSSAEANILQITNTKGNHTILCQKIRHISADHLHTKGTCWTIYYLEILKIVVFSNCFYFGCSQDEIWYVFLTRQSIYLQINLWRTEIHGKKNGIVV